MEWLAMITMVIDHMGVVWFPHDSMWRVIGRIAFPIYAYFVAVGMTRTRSPKRYIIRMLGLAVLSQVPYTLLFGAEAVNVIGSFFVIVSALYLVEATPPIVGKVIVFIAAAALMQLFPFEYGAYGLLLVAVFRYVRSGWQIVLLHALLNVMYSLHYGVPVQLWSIVPTLALAWLPDSLKFAMRVPRPLWRMFYPGHLLLLYLITLLR